jgi:hypothetical protein
MGAAWQAGPGVEATEAVDVTLTEYPGADHVLDGRNKKTPMVAAKSQSTRMPAPRR